MRQKCIVELQYGVYASKQVVYCDENDETDTIIAKAWRQVDANFLPMAYRSAVIISREPYSGE
jgi:hypothetical protein